MIPQWIARRNIDPDTSGAAAVDPPAIAPDSMLWTMSAIDSPDARQYASIVLDDLRALAQGGLFPHADSAPHEQIHALKNAIAPTGSRVLLAACDKLRIDMTHHIDPNTLDRRFRSIANATAVLVDHHLVAHGIKPHDRNPR